MITNKDLMRKINMVGKLLADVQFEQVKIHNRITELIKAKKDEGGI